MPMYASEKATLDDGRAPVGSASPGANWDSGALQLANNHLSDCATYISVTDADNHKTYSATVSGYDL
jgi:hypothetical protein